MTDHTARNPSTLAVDLLTQAEASDARLLDALAEADIPEHLRLAIQHHIESGCAEAIACAIACGVGDQYRAARAERHAEILAELRALPAVVTSYAPNDRPPRSPESDAADAERGIRYSTAISVDNEGRRCLVPVKQSDRRAAA